MVICQPVRHYFVQQRPTNRRVFHFCRRDKFAIMIFDCFLNADFYLGLKTYLSSPVGTKDFFNIRKRHAFSEIVDLLSSHVINTKHNILRRHNNRLARGGEQHVICRHHQCTRFKLCFDRQRNMDCHLVAIKVSVVGSTNKWMELNCFSFNQHWLESLNS